VTGRGLGMTGAPGQWQQLCVAWGDRVCNDMSVPSRNRSIQSRTQRTVRVSELIGHSGAFGHMRSDTSGRDRSSLEPFWTVTGC
jgi:hypothetical protein